MSKFIDVGGKRFEVGKEYIYLGCQVVIIIGKDDFGFIELQRKSGGLTFFSHAHLLSTSNNHGTITDAPWEPEKGEWCRFEWTSCKRSYAKFSHMMGKHYIDMGKNAWTQCSKISDELKAALEDDNRQRQPSADIYGSNGILGY